MSDSVHPHLPRGAALYLATTLGLIWVERALARRPSTTVQPSPQLGKLVPGMSLFLVACLVLALGFQIHTSFASAPQYLRFSTPDRLEYLLPIFWIGYSFAMFPGAVLAKRYGTLPVIACAGVVGAMGALISAQSASIDILIVGQLLAGGSWGCIMMAGFSAALAFGRTGREGTALGLLFAMLALATFSRMGAAAAQLNKIPEYVALLVRGPVTLWLAGAVVFVILAATRRTRETG